MDMDEFTVFTDSGGDEDGEEEHLLWEQPTSAPRRTAANGRAKRTRFPSSASSVYDALGGGSGLLVSEDDLRRCRRSLAGNLLALCAVYALTAVAAPLHSWDTLTLNLAPDQVVLVVGTLYGCTALSAALAPYLIACLGCRRDTADDSTPGAGCCWRRWRFDARSAVRVGSAGSAVFVVSRFFTSSLVLVPGAVVGGLTQGLLLVGVSVCVCTCACEYVRHGGGGGHARVQHVFAALLIMWGAGAAPLANTLLAILILPPAETGSAGSFGSSPGVSASSGFSSVEALPSGTVAAVDLECGIGYQWTWDVTRNGTSGVDVAEEYRVQALLGCHLFCSLAALLLAVLCVPPPPAQPFLPPEAALLHPKDGDEDDDVPAASLDGSGRRSVRPCWLVRDSPQLLLMPVFAAVGGAQMVGYTVFMQAYPACTSPASPALPAYLRLLLAAGSALSAPLAGLVAGSGGGGRGGGGGGGRVAGLLLSLVGLAVLLAVLVLVYPPPPVAAYYAVAVFWGLGVGALEALLMGMLPVVFIMHPHQAYGSYFTLRTLAYSAIYACLVAGVATLYVLLALLGTILLATITYIAMEIKVRLREQQLKRGGVGFVMSDQSTWLPTFDPITIKKNTAVGELVPRIRKPRDNVVSNKWST